ncbi:MAG TPA: glycosyltransferase family protein [Rhodocyclaceae bacterium]|nr:glycosyltransferase family protein [Rhodocyclaceae bacterium]
MILGILQARMSSRRLPGKAMLPILGRPMLELQLERVGRARSLDALCLATSTDSADDSIATLGEALAIPVHRGSLDDVLDRFHGAAARFAPDTVVRMTGDCPLADPQIIDAVVAYFRDGGYDYASNALEPTFPDGLDVEVCRYACLETAWREAELPSEREHVMPFIHRRRQRFRVGIHRNPVDLSALRWTVDEPEDYAFVKAVYEALYPDRPAFTTADVLDLLRRQPALARINDRHVRNAGAATSLARDALHRGDAGPENPP